MKISEIKTDDLIEYCKIDAEDLTKKEKANFENYLKVAIEFIKSFTGLSADEIDNHEDFYIVVCILVEDMYDNRKLYVDKTNLNKIVEFILNMHSVNFL